VRTEDKWAKEIGGRVWVRQQ